MATIVNNPPANNAQPSENNSGLNWVFALILLIVFMFLVFYFGLPALRRVTTSNVPQINVPDQIDVNVNTPDGQ